MEDKIYSPSEIAAMYAFFPGTEIHRRTGIKFNQIYKVLRQADVEIQPRGRRPVLVNPGKETLSELLLSKSQTAVADEFGVSKRTVQRWLRQF